MGRIFSPIDHDTVLWERNEFLEIQRGDCAQSRYPNHKPCDVVGNEATVKAARVTNDCLHSPRPGERRPEAGGEQRQKR